MVSYTVRPFDEILATVRQNTQRVHDAVIQRPDSNFSALVKDFAEHLRNGGGGDAQAKNNIAIHLAQNPRMLEQLQRVVGDRMVGFQGAGEHALALTVTDADGKIQVMRMTRAQEAPMPAYGDVLRPQATSSVGDVRISYAQPAVALSEFVEEGVINRYEAEKLNTRHRADMFRDGLHNQDPHLGNTGVTPDGRIVATDPGAVGTLQGERSRVAALPAGSQKEASLQNLRELEANAKGDRLNPPLSPAAAPVGVSRVRVAGNAAGAAMGTLGLVHAAQGEQLRQDIAAGGVQAGVAIAKIGTDAASVGAGVASLADDTARAAGATQGLGRMGQVVGRAALPLQVGAGALELSAALAAGDDKRAAGAIGSTAGGILGGLAVGAAAGAAAGAVSGSVVPGIGTVAVGIVGGVVGGVAGAVVGEELAQRYATEAVTAIRNMMPAIGQSPQTTGQRDFTTFIDRLPPRTDPSMSPQLRGMVEANAARLEAERAHTAAVSSPQGGNVVAARTALERAEERADAAYTGLESSGALAKVRSELDVREQAQRAVAGLKTSVERPSDAAGTPQMPSVPNEKPQPSAAAART